jgi:hypothetical protein
MFVVGSSISILWPLASSKNLVVSSDLDVLVVSAFGVAVYHVDPLVDFVAPTVTSAGTGTFTFTLYEHGEYLVKLVTGSSASYVVLDEFDLPARYAIPKKYLAHDLRVLTTKSMGIELPFVQAQALSGALNTATLNSRALNHVSL